MSKKILFVDDSPSMRHVISTDLTEQGYQVTTAVDGIDGLKKLDIDRYNVIISDLNMPNMNGLEFFKECTKNGHHKYSKLIMLTTDSSEEMKESGKSVGVNVWIAKPFRAKQLISILEKVLG